MILSILIFIGLIFLCMVLVALAVCLQGKIKIIPPVYDFSNDDKVRHIK